MRQVLDVEGVSDDDVSENINLMKIQKKLIENKLKIANEYFLKLLSETDDNIELENYVVIGKETKRSKIIDVPGLTAELKNYISSSDFHEYFLSYSKAKISKCLKSTGRDYEEINDIIEGFYGDGYIEEEIKKSLKIIKRK